MESKLGKNCLQRKGINEVSSTPRAREPREDRGPAEVRGEEHEAEVRVCEQITTRESVCEVSVRTVIREHTV